MIINKIMRTLNRSDPNNLQGFIITYFEYQEKYDILTDNRICVNCSEIQYFPRSRQRKLSE